MIINSTHFFKENQKYFIAAHTAVALEILSFTNMNYENIMRCVTQAQMTSEVIV